MSPAPGPDEDGTVIEALTGELRATCGYFETVSENKWRSVALITEVPPFL